MPVYLVERLASLSYLIAERAKTARQYIKEVLPGRDLNDWQIVELNKRTAAEEKPRLLDPALEGHSIGLLSEAGCPGVADPGAEVVRLAHERGIEVVPMVGPSSILLALMASGMSGQQFCFHGYLPPKRPELARELKRLEQQAMRYRQTQLFIETPYRNGSLLETALHTLAPATRLLVAADLTLPTQYIRALRIVDWQQTPLPDLHKRPAVFAVFAE